VIFREILSGEIGGFIVNVRVLLFPAARWIDGIERVVLDAGTLCEMFPKAIVVGFRTAGYDNFAV
jgi:hypothetical protein